MNNKKYIRALKVITVFSIIITTGLSFILHFAYELSHYNQLVALFVPVNESTWEHTKLLFFPMVVLLFIAYFILCLPKNSPYSQKSGVSSSSYTASFLFAIVAGSITGILSIIIIFYTLLGIIGHSIEWLNIAIFVVADIIAHIIFYRIAITPFANSYAYHAHNNHTSTNINKGSNYTRIPAWISLVIITACITLFIVFTFYPPHIGLFCDPVTHTYGPQTSSHPFRSLFKKI